MSNNNAEKTYQTLEEYEKNAIDLDEFSGMVQNNNIVFLRGEKSSVCAGKGLGIKVNCSIGANHDGKEYKQQLDKISTIAGYEYPLDIMMDLSTASFKVPLYRRISELLGCPAGTIPYYTCFDQRKGIDPGMLLNTIEKQAADGVSFMTFHFTADMELFQKAKVRQIPVISRGGSLLLRDMMINKRSSNILTDHFQDIVKICRRYSVVVSVGTVFRPSVFSDALDEVNLLELSEQDRIIDALMASGIHVMQEGLGHIPINKLEPYSKILRRNKYIPFMPLGPVVSDQTYGLDHITAAIGAAYLASLNGADIINAITREEHTGGIPSTESSLEALSASYVVRSVINESRFPDYFTSHSHKNRNCMNKGETVGCDRCGRECPFLL